MGSIRAVRQGSGKSCSGHPLPYFSLPALSLSSYFILGIESRRDNILWKKVWGSGSELGGVRVWRSGPFFKHTLELRFNRKIFIIFIVDYIYQKGF